MRTNRRSRSRLLVTALLTATLLLAGCSGETGDTTLPPDTTTTSEPDTTTTVPPTTTSVPAAPSTTSPVDEGAEGSGCTPGEGDLADGEWYGEAASVSANEIEFDLACWFTGDAAIRAAAEDGEESPPPNDYYVRNVNTTLRTILVGDEVMVVWYPEIGDPASETTISYQEWLDALDDRGGLMLAVWIEIEEGVISSIREQWVP